MGEYDSLLIEIKLKHTERAKEIIPKLCYTLKKEDPLLSDKDIGEWVKRDLIDIWSRTTIYENLPEEFKDLEKSSQTKEGINQKKVRERTPTASDVQKENQTTEKSTSPSDLTSIEVSSSGQSISKESKPETESDLDPGFDPDIPVKLPDLAWHQNQNEDIDYRRKYEEEHLRVGRLEEMLGEQREQIKSLIESVNKQLTNKKDKDKQKIEETPEYKAIESRALIAEQERDEYKQVASQQMKAHPEQTFQSAAIIPQTKETSRISGDLEVEFPGKELSTFFMDVRNVKNVMYLQIQGNKVTGWQSDYAREKSNARIKQS